MQIRCRCIVKYLLLTAIATVGLTLLLISRRHDGPESAFYQTFGSSLELLLPSSSVEVGNGHLSIGIIKKYSKLFNNLAKSFKGFCNPPFKIPKRQLLYVNNSHEYVGSIVLVSTGFYSPTEEEKHSSSAMKLASKHLDCDYVSAARDVFNDTLYTRFVDELFKMVQRDKSLRSLFGIADKSAECKPGQLTTFGLAHHLSAGLKIADGFVHIPHVINAIKAAISRPDRSKFFSVSMQRSAANSLGTFASLYALSYKLNLSISLADLWQKVRPTVYETEYFCDSSSIPYQSANNLSSLTCNCAAVPVLERSVSERLDRTLLTYLVADKATKVRRYLESYLDLVAGKPHRLVDVAQASLAPLCSLEQSFTCPKKGKRHNCFTDNQIGSLFGMLEHISTPTNIQKHVLSTLRALPFGATLFSKLYQILDTTLAIPTLQIITTSPRALTDLLSMLRLSQSANSAAYSPLQIAAGTVVSIEVFRTKVRQPSKMVMRLVINGVNAMEFPSLLCDRSYRGMCDLDEVITNVLKLAPINLGTEDYNRICKDLASLSS